MWRRSNILNLIGLAVIFYLFVIVFQTVKHNYELNRQITNQQKQIEDLTAREAQLKYDVQFYKTNSFIERSARANLGLMQPGEGVIVLPKTDPTPEPVTSGAKSPVKQQSNIRQWWHFLFG